MDTVMQMRATVEVRVPDIGDFKDIPVVELLVKPGDLVELDQPVVTLESDKATLDVPSSSAGRVAAVAVDPGTKVSVGSLLLTLHPVTDSVTESVPVLAETNASPPISAIRHEATEFPASIDSVGTSSGDRETLAGESDDGAGIHAGPTVRRLARQVGADLTRVTGSGRGARILIEDLHDFVRDGLKAAAERAPPPPPEPKIDFSKFGEIMRMPLTRIRRISGAALARNWATIPHVTNFEEADVTDLESFRVGVNQEMAADPKVTLLSFLVKAVAVTLKAHPAFNASLDGSDLILKRFINIGVAVDSPDGLLVPVIRDADKRGIVDIARDLAGKASAARAGKLMNSDLAGGTFTISSLGGIGGTGFTPIINAPEIAILGVSRASMQPRWNGAEFKARLILPLALSWDHRATDGVAAARFLVNLAACLSDFRRAML